MSSRRRRACTSVGESGWEASADCANATVTSRIVENTISKGRIFPRIFVEMKDWLGRKEMAKKNYTGTVRVRQTNSEWDLGKRADWGQIKGFRWHNCET